MSNIMGKSPVPIRGYRVEVGHTAARASDLDDALSLSLFLCRSIDAPIGTPVAVTHKAGTSCVLGVWDGEAIAWRDTAASHYGTGRPTGWVDRVPDEMDAYKSSVRVSRGKKGTSRKVVRHGRATVTTIDGARLDERQVDRWATDWARLACDQCETVRASCANGDDTREVHAAAIDAGDNWCHECARGCGCMPDPIGGTSVVWQQVIHRDRGIAATLLRQGIATGTPQYSPKRWAWRMEPDPVPTAGVARSAREPETVGNVVRLFAPADRGLMFKGNGPAMVPPSSMSASERQARSRDRRRAAVLASTFTTAELEAIETIAAVVVADRAEVGATLAGRRFTFAPARGLPGRIAWSLVDGGEVRSARSVRALVRSLATAASS